jgi:2-haloacid dehalogenase
METRLETPEWITFDANGTLVDFNLDPIIVERLGPRAEQVDVDELLAVAAQHRFEEVLGEYRPYREILRASLKRTFEHFGFEYTDEDGAALIEAVPTFGPFPDTPSALERLRTRCKLCIISNNEDDLIAGNLEKLGVPIDRVITAEQARGYKPSLDVFRYTFRELGVDQDDVVHVAQGFNYDIMPAHELGLRRIWINRRGIQGDPAYGPYHEQKDLTGVPALLGID